MSSPARHRQRLPFLTHLSILTPVVRSQEKPEYDTVAEISGISGPTTETATKSLITDSYGDPTRDEQVDR